MLVNVTGIQFQIWYIEDKVTYHKAVEYPKIYPAFGNNFIDKLI